jgi:hypothetical protein
MFAVGDRLASTFASVIAWSRRSLVDGALCFVAT